MTRANSEIDPSPAATALQINHGFSDGSVEPEVSLHSCIYCSICLRISNNQDSGCPFKSTHRNLQHFQGCAES